MIMIARSFQAFSEAWSEIMGTVPLSKDDELKRLKVYALRNPKSSWGKKHQVYLMTQYWSEIRSVVLVRDGNKCVKCGSTSSLQVDHKKYGKWGEEKIDDLQTLCVLCHAKKTKRFDFCAGDLYKDAVKQKRIIGDRQLFAVVRS